MAMNLLALIVFICAIMIIVIGLYTWQLRATNGAKTFSAVMLSMAVYILAYSFELSSVTLEMMVFWNKIEYIGIVSFPTFYMVFTSQFTGNTTWMKKKNWLILAILPAVFLLIKLFDGWLHLIYQSVAVNNEGLLPLLSFEKGPVYYLVVAYNLVMVTVATFLLILKRRHASSLYLRQTNIILAVSALIYILYLVYISGYDLFPNLKELDLNPFVYTLWGLAISYAIFRYKLFDLVPVAREALIETLGDGVLVLDEQSRLVDSNPKSHAIFGWSKPPTGMTLEDLGIEFIDPARLKLLEDNLFFETQIEENGRKTDYEVTVSILKNSQEEKIGTLIVLHDITLRKQTEKELHELSLADELSGLINRRGFFVLAEQLCSFCLRTQLNAVLFFIDMDGLKAINDQFGHAIGDQAIQDMGGILKNAFRSSDIVARYGGDEFVLLAIETRQNSKAGMLKRLEAQRSGFNAGEKREYELAFSVGCAQFEWKNPRSLEALIEEADKAMYEMKAEKKAKKNPK